MTPIMLAKRCKARLVIVRVVIAVERTFDLQANNLCYSRLSSLALLSSAVGVTLSSASTVSHVVVVDTESLVDLALEGIVVIDPVKLVSSIWISAAI
jgi:hypothetical protein